MAQDCAACLQLCACTARPGQSTHQPRMLWDGEDTVPEAATDGGAEGPGADPGGARGSAALTSACTAARRASTKAGSRPSPLPPAVLPVAADVVVVVATDVVVAAGSAIPLLIDENRCEVFYVPRETLLAAAQVDLVS